MVSRYQIDYLCLADELFARKPERMKAFCEGMRRHGIRWWAQFRVDDVTPDMMGVLKDGGCDIMSFGLESADNRVLRSMRKGTTVEQIERALKMVYDAGISMEGAFIFGDLAETWETAQNTLQWWREHAQYKINLNVISVYPGSHLYQYACEHGIIRDRVQFLRDGCPHVNVSKLTAGDHRAGGYRHGRGRDTRLPQPDRGAGCGEPQERAPGDRHRVARPGPARPHVVAVRGGPPLVCHRPQSHPESHPWRL
jgi:hypothetical protein